MNKYGCHNRPPFRPVVQSQQYGVTFPFTMNPNCQYIHTDLGRVDPRCEGCKHKAEAKQ